MSETKSLATCKATLWRRGRQGLFAAVLATLVSCGGGGEQQHAGVSSGGTGSFSGGPVRAMGSIVVTGIHFDQRTARTVVNAEGAAVPWQDLDVGMMVEVEGDAVTVTGGREEARSEIIRVTSDLLGPVSASTDYSAGAATLYVMGQPVHIDPDPVSGTVLRRKVGSSWQAISLADIPLHGIVEVHGFQDVATGRYVATRVELKNAGDAVPHYVVRGVIEDLSQTGCRIGAQQIALDYLNHAPPTGLRNGVVARIKLDATAPGVAEPWQGQEMRLSQPMVTRSGQARLEGLVTERLSGTAFSVNGVAVQTRSACAACLPGTMVQVRGTMENAVLQADVVTLVP